MKRNKFQYLSMVLIFSILLNIISYVPVMALSEGKQSSIKEAIETTKGNIKSLSKYEDSDTLALNLLGENVDSNKINIYKDKRLKTYPKNIINLIAAGKDPEDYEGKNYVKEVLDGQIQNGLFVVSNEQADSYPENMAYGIIAMDMAKAPYNKESAVKLLMSFAKEADEGKSFDDQVVTTSLGIIALSSHKDVEGVSKLIEELKKYLKSEQLYDGSFSNNSLSDEDLESEGNSVATAMVIQALVALEENPLADEWIKEGESLLDALLSFKEEDKFIYNSSYRRVSEDEATSFAILALKGIETGKSAYKIVKQEQKKPNFIEIVADNTSIKEGKIISLETKILDKDKDIVQGNEIIWAIDDENVAYIDEKGILKAKAKGTTKVHASIKGNEDINTHISISVYAPVAKSIEILNTEESIEIGDSIPLKSMVKDQDGEDIKNANLIWSVDNKKLASIDNDGFLKARKEGIITVSAQLGNDQNIKTTKNFNIKKPSSLEDISVEDKAKIKNEIENLKKFYEMETVESMVPIALSKVNTDKKILDKVYIKRGESSLIYAQNTLALIGSGKDPKDYKGNDYVKGLVKSQRKEGEKFQGQFIINDILDIDAPAILAYSIIALETAKADYDKELAINALMDLILNNKNTSNTYSNIESNGMALIALASHPEIKGVDNAISTIITTMKSSQRPDGTFESGNKSRALAIVIQGLVANNINPLSKEWIKDKSMLDALLKFKAAPRGNNKYGGFAKFEGGAYEMVATSHVVGALVDLHYGESIFGIKNDSMGEIKEPAVISIEGVKEGKIYTETINIDISTDEGTWKATLNGEDFFGGAISKAGKYTLKVVAELEGVKSEKEVNFIVDMPPYEKVRVRVEGNEKTLFNDIVDSSISQSNVLEVLMKAVGKENINGTGNGEGYMVTGILGENQVENFGWSYYVKRGLDIKQPMIGAAGFIDIKDSEGKFNYDEIVFYMTHYKYDGDFKSYTNIPMVSLRSLDGNHEITLLNKIDKTPLKNADINIEGIGDFKTDDNGKVTFKAPSDIYNITIGKRDKYIEIVPNTYVVSLPVEEEILETIYDEDKISEGIKDPFIKYILIGMDKDGKISSEIFEKSLGKNKILRFINKDMTWEFETKNIRKENVKSIDIDLNKDSQNKESILKEYNDAKILSFKDNGILPAKAKITMKHDTAKPVYLYYYDEKTHNVEKVSGPHKTADGNIVFEIEHCSDYFLSSIDSDKKLEVKLQDVLMEITRYYEDKDIYSFREALGLSNISKNINVKDKIEVFEVDNVSDAINNIISLIAAGENPKDYKGKNYVKMLKDSQNKDGAFVILDGDEDWPTLQAFAVIALDMSKADYDKEKALNHIISMSKDGHYGDVDTTAMVITALSNHKDIKGIEEIINSSIEYINNKQLESGGFESYGKENPYTLSSVIQALISNEDDIFSKRWVKNGNTLLDALLTFKTGDHFEFKSEWGTETKMSTEQAILALGDIYNKKSVYKYMTLSGNEVEAKEGNKIEVKEGNEIEVKEVEEKKGNEEVKEEITSTHLEDGNADSENTDKANIKENAMKIIQDGKSESKVDTKELVKTGSIIGFKSLIAISMIMIIAGIIIIKRKKKKSVI
ncbi:surface/cell-adhesion protein [Clostridium putrefaciens]|uniref:Surface/cell-adhesion protein n=1 Tax=Clostridium putrefaciens TaxID=99675 RepID=A0A381J771_9CLOT|nr:Ig-like domain-containing protein [Clostridium putrefaciens]SUY46097.1 surface/cell-adhesion protein [Clostridium putrefaciens]